MTISGIFDIISLYKLLFYRKKNIVEGKKVFGILILESNGDWSIDESLRFDSLYHLKDSNLLPYPALKGENDAYIFNQTGIDAIKSELVRGRAVMVSISADDVVPGMVAPEGAPVFMRHYDIDGNPTDDKKATIWASYAYDEEYDPSDPSSVNKYVRPCHSVCVVGYDDNFPIRSYTAG